jgi:hypothetical protein
MSDLWANLGHSDAQDIFWFLLHMAGPASIVDAVAAPLLSLLDAYRHFLITHTSGAARFTFLVCRVRNFQNITSLAARRSNFFCILTLSYHLLRIIWVIGEP